MKSKLSLSSSLALLFCLSVVPSALAIDKTTRRSSRMLPNWATQEEELQQQQLQQDEPETASFRLGGAKKTLPRLFTTGAHTANNNNKGVVLQQQNFQEQASINNNTVNNIDISPVATTTTNISRFRMPAEHEPVSMVIMAWDPFIGDMLTRIAELVVGAGAEVYMMISNYDYYAAPDLRDIVGLHPLHRVEYDSLWTRDYGPVTGIIPDNTTSAGESDGVVGTILKQRNGRLEVVDPLYRLGYTRPLDDGIPCQLALGILTLPSCRSTQLILDGGNLMFDGNGALFTTLATYHWNEQDFDQDQVDERLQLAFGVDTIHVLEYARIGTVAADGTGHIDMFAKILAPCVVIVAQTDNVTSIFYDATNQAAEYFEQLECKASPTLFYQVHRVPGWADDDGGTWTTWYTYTNSLTIGNTVIVPSYYNQELNDKAQSVYQTAAPHLTVEFVNADEIIHYGGAVHCLTREVPALRNIIDDQSSAAAATAVTPLLVIP